MGKGSRNRAAVHKAPEAQATSKTSLGIKLAFIGVAVLCLIALVYYIITGTGILQRNTAAMRVGEEEFSAAYMDICYSNVRADVLNEYYYYLYMYGYPLDSTLDAYACIFDNSITFREYFMDQAQQQALHMMVLTQEGRKAGFTPEDPEGWKALLDELYAAAEEEDMSVSKYIKAVYGNALNLDTMTAFYQMNYYASSYYEEIFDKSYSTAQMDAFYAEHADDYDVLDAYVYAFAYKTYTYQAPAEGETLKDGEPTSAEEATQMSVASKNKAEKDSDAMLIRLKNGEDFDVVAKEYFDLEAQAEAEEGTTAQSFTTALKSQALTAYASVLQTWLTDENRAVGDRDVVIDSTNQIYYVIQYVDRQMNPAQAASVRHILLSYETAEDDATDEKKAEVQAHNQEQKEKAEALLQEWQNGAADEDSFAKLANTHSEDTGSNTVGGLYEKFAQGDMVEAFDQWCFDESRRPGDTGIVETEYGVHVMYYVSDDGDYSYWVMLDDMRSADYDEWYEEACKNYQVEYFSFGQSLVNN